MYRRLLDSVGEDEGGMFWENSFETCILSLVKQTTSPGWMHETSAWAWCTGKTQRDQVEREVGGGIGIGIHVTPWLIHVNVWQNPLQCCKVVGLQLMEINGEKKKKWNRGIIFWPKGKATLGVSFCWYNVFFWFKMCPFKSWQCKDKFDFFFKKKIRLFY